MGTPPDWTRDEIDAAVAEYFRMLDEQGAGRPFVKAEARRCVAARLTRRSEKAVEYKFQNISAILDDLGLPWVRGYSPARNVQQALRERVREVARARQSPEFARDRHPTADRDEFERRVARLRARGTLPRPRGNPTPRRVPAQAMVFERDPLVKAWVLQEARGRCELCGESGPFVLPSGERHLEVHHARPLVDGGPDTVDNAVALCPNCHRRLHLAADAEQQLDKLYRQVRRLMRA